MRDHDGDLKQFIHAKRAWYADTALQGEGYVDRVGFGFYSPDGGTSGEMKMAWYKLGGKEVPRLECYNDAWHALAQFKDLIDMLGNVDNVDITPTEFCQILEQCGFTDVTPARYEDSYPD